MSEITPFNVDELLIKIAQSNSKKICSTWFKLREVCKRFRKVLRFDKLFTIKITDFYIYKDAQIIEGTHLCHGICVKYNGEKVLYVFGSICPPRCIKHDRTQEFCDL
jgi:hypothetical protein